MKKNFNIPEDLRQDLIEFAKAYNYFSPSDIEDSIKIWIETNDIDALYYYFRPSAEDENLHLTCTRFANMDLNDVIILHQNTRKKVELLKEKERLFKLISAIKIGNSNNF